MNKRIKLETRFLITRSAPNGSWAYPRKRTLLQTSPAFLSNQIRFYFQAMVMNAMMVNSMALNGAIFMTIRNLIFGPKGGPKIKYVNYGYSKQKIKSKRPEVIIHSPAAFIKKPEPHPKHPPPHFSSHSESFEEPSGPYSGSSSSEFEEPSPHFDYGQTGPDYPMSSNNRDTYPDFSSPNHIRRQTDNLVVRRRNPNRRKNGPKRKDRIRIKRPNIPSDVKAIVDKYANKPETKTIPLLEMRNRVRTTTPAPASYEESEEYQHQHQYQYPPVVRNTQDVRYHFNMPSTESSNSWSVGIARYPVTNAPYLEPESDYEFDIFKVMPNVRNKNRNKN